MGSVSYLDSVRSTSIRTPNDNLKSHNNSINSRAIHSDTGSITIIVMAPLTFICSGLLFIILHEPYDFFSGVRSFLSNIGFCNKTCFAFGFKFCLPRCFLKATYKLMYVPESQYYEPGTFNLENKLSMLRACLKSYILDIERQALSARTYPKMRKTSSRDLDQENSLRNSLIFLIPMWRWRLRVANRSNHVFTSHLQSNL